MSNLLNSLIYGMSNIFSSVGPEIPREDQPDQDIDGGCCQSLNNNMDGCCQQQQKKAAVSDNRGCCSTSTKTDKTDKTETGQSSGCCRDNKNANGCCSTSSNSCKKPLVSQRDDDHITTVIPPVTTKSSEQQEQLKPSKENGCCQQQQQSSEGKTADAHHNCGCKDGTADRRIVSIDQIKIIYSTLTNTAKVMAAELKEKIEQSKSVKVESPIEVIDITEYDNDNLLQETAVCIFVLSTYNVEGPLDWFTNWLHDLRYDFRVDRDVLKKLRYAVCGLGDSVYNEEFNVAAANIDKWLGRLGATRIFPLGACDKSHDQKAQFDLWSNRFVSELVEDEHILEFTPVTMAFQSDDEDNDEDDDSNSDDGKQADAGINDYSGDEMMDVEDIGKMANKLKEAKIRRAEEEEVFENSKARAKRLIGSEFEEDKSINGMKKSSSIAQQPREMVSPIIRKNLTKQGYKVVGTHSGVKICRWTKSALRGRGFCYKHAFYGIQSHLCMETTPSLACANKCVFCWRHHTNPVGTTWRWKIDDPKFILDGAMENHYKMIKQLKGVPGVKADRFEEAFTIRHCALSLVGEPIFYPHINEFVEMLHEKNISSFLVTNAQFPEKIADMVPVTQLYVSVDAATKESLRKIDRPLFRDFWERFIGSLEQLAKKGQRTVYRMTLVKGQNTAEINEYVELIRRGKPSFIEVKGVTYCGYSGASNLTMANVPFHVEVIDFCQQIVDKLGGEYEISAEHAHSCSILIAHKSFKINGEWYTHIDYPKFFELVKSGKPFGSLDYVAKTPEWAVHGHEAAGFDPNETRHYRKNRKVVEPPKIASINGTVTTASSS
ncbi:radical SAM superfamily-domain-containing protein [Mycotypha africana]|uniref:radical SAM superfamily-domain-containing protein n=1 Tax=Mycotypha africana TaxID=64632 RepID=UPI00230194B9|nr:radical SAM superfamily-domain-containing protein [Mycotypha africana]KAI8991668.1 radical SAM superfamily-domain-containing protein [Mycotypha africana]